MIEDKKMQLLNPQIAELEVGVRQLRTIKIYPLSMSDQLKTTGLIVETIQQLFKERETDNFTFAESVRQTVEVNLGKILTYITDDGESLMSEITNAQAVDIAEVIYAVNYGEVLEKKVKNLIEKIRSKFQFQKSQPISSEDTPSTDLNIFQEEVSEKED